MFNLHAKSIHQVCNSTTFPVDYRTNWKQTFVRFRIICPSYAYENTKQSSFNTEASAPYGLNLYEALNICDETLCVNVETCEALFMQQQSVFVV